MNQFADLTRTEFQQTYINNNAKKTFRKLSRTLSCTGSIIDAPNPPSSIDWTSKHVNIPIHQGNCGSNWALAATAAVEGLYSLKRGKLLKFSEQQLVDCSGSYGNEGCSGGFMDQAFWYMIDNGFAEN